MAGLTVKDLQARFPHPVRHSADAEADPKRYCVGASCVQASGIDVSWPSYELRFPGETSLSQALHVLNPKLNDQVADLFASLIIDSNDQGNFATAWEYVDEALHNDGGLPSDIEAWLDAETDPSLD